MPELPEVETVVRTLERQIGNTAITDVNVLFEKILENTGKEEFAKRLQNKRFTSFDRRGKYLVFTLEDEVLIVHLRMEGKFYIEPIGSPLEKHTHIVFTLNDGRELRYNDVRKFGRMNLYKKDEEKTCLKGLGKEPFDETLSASYLKEKYARTSLAIKSALLDQSVITGIGNIYANEICFESGILPTRKANSLSDEEYETVITKCHSILKKAIAAGGTTIRSYTSSLGVSGLFQLSLSVYGEKQCPVCGNEIKKIMLNGRGTYYCSNCQK